MLNRGSFFPLCSFIPRRSGVDDGGAPRLRSVLLGETKNERRVIEEEEEEKEERNESDREERGILLLLVIG